MKTLPLYPELGWSHKRSLALECPRYYHHEVYGSWHGWDCPPTDPAWTLYRLKHLLTPQRLVGTLVHDAAKHVIEGILRGEDPPLVHELHAYYRQKLQKVQSQDLPSFLRRPKAAPMFLDAWLGDTRTLAQSCAEADETLFRCLVNLLESTVLDEVLTCGRRGVLVADSRDSILLPLGSEIIKVWAAPDLVLRQQDGIDIVDFKTGSSIEEVEDAQLGAYTLYVINRWRVPPGVPVRGRVVSLAGYERVIDLTPEGIQEAQERIRRDVETMRSYLADDQTGEPVEVGLFEMLPAGSRKCLWCVHVSQCNALRETTDAAVLPPQAATQSSDGCSGCAMESDVADVRTGVLWCSACWASEQRQSRTL
jgi:hypothetical protein